MNWSISFYRTWWLWSTRRFAQAISLRLRRRPRCDARQCLAVTPLLKKSSLEAASSRTLMSNLSFFSKAIDRIAAEHFVSYLRLNDLWPAVIFSLSVGVTTSFDTDCIIAGRVRHLRRYGTTGCYIAYFFRPEYRVRLVDHDILVDQLRQSFGGIFVALFGCSRSLMDALSRSTLEFCRIDVADIWRTIMFKVKGSHVRYPPIAKIYVPYRKSGLPNPSVVSEFWPIARK